MLRVVDVGAVYLKDDVTLPEDLCIRNCALVFEGDQGAVPNTCPIADGDAERLAFFLGDPCFADNGGVPLRHLRVGAGFGSDVGGSDVRSRDILRNGGSLAGRIVRRQFLRGMEGGVRWREQVVNGRALGGKALKGNSSQSMLSHTLPIAAPTQKVVQLGWHATSHLAKAASSCQRMKVGWLVCTICTNTTKKKTKMKLHVLEMWHYSRVRNAVVYDSRVEGGSVGRAEPGEDGGCCRRCALFAYLCNSLRRCLRREEKESYQQNRQR